MPLPDTDEGQVHPHLVLCPEGYYYWINKVALDEFFVYFKK